MSTNTNWLSFKRGRGEVFSKFEICYEELMPEYRLCKKKNGDLVLQRLKILVKGSERKLLWIDLETIEEGAEE